MNAEIKAKWVAALRSGEYLQGKHQLKIRKIGETRFCCLGVLQDLRDKACPFAPQTDIHQLNLPVATRAWAGLDTDLDVVIDGVTASLPEHNDGVLTLRPMTFLQIADAIEEQL